MPVYSFEDAGIDAFWAIQDICAVTTISDCPKRVVLRVHEDYMRRAKVEKI